MQYQLRELLEIVKRTMDELFGEFQFWCVGEIASIKTVGKNTYIELVEFDEQGSVVARSRASIFQASILQSFLDETKLQTNDLKGQKILFQGRISYHAEYGMGIIINEISSTYTLGALQKSQENILALLQKEGILHANKQCVRGYPPYRLAIISSETSAGLEDFCRILDDAKVAYTYTLFPCAIQGNKAKDEVYEQLKSLYRIIQADPSYTAVCIVRGGGGVSGILWQNDLDIARGVCHMQVPVVVAVGHTQDTSILEQVAYAHAKTPSDAAHLIISYYDQWRKQCDGLYEEIREAIVNKIHHYTRDIPHCRESIQYACQQKFHTIQDKVKMVYDSIYQYHPQVLLRHGYAYLTQKGKIVTDAEVGSLKSGDSLTITTATHHVETKVESIETRE